MNLALRTVAQTVVELSAFWLARERARYEIWAPIRVQAVKKGSQQGHRGKISGNRGTISNCPRETIRVLYFPEGI